MGFVRDSGRGGNFVFTNRSSCVSSIAVCLVALGYCVTSLADNTATCAARIVEPERLNLRATKQH